MGIAKKVKEKVKGAKDKVIDTKDKTKGMTADTRGKVASTKEKVSSSSGMEETEFEEGAPGTEVGRKDDSLKEYREKEPMTPAKIKEHEPTAVKRDMTEKIVEPGQEVAGVNPEEAKEKARRSGMTKGTAGAAETDSKYE
jgi:hypothetical protein